MPKLAERVFHAKLGSDLQRSERLALLARALAPFCGADAELAERAVRLCKADLTTAMVGEFPGCKASWAAITHCTMASLRRWPMRSPSTIPPKARPTAADGSRQHRRGARGQARYAGRLLRHRRATNGLQGPYAQRRAALGGLRIVIENRLRLNLRSFLGIALNAYPHSVIGDRPRRSWTIFSPSSPIA